VTLGGATFNLAALNTAQSSSWGYRVKDDRDNAVSGNYTYIFNVCGDLSAEFFEDPTFSVCATTYDTPFLPNTNRTAPAFQFANQNRFWSVAPNEACHRLGDSLDIATSYSYSLLDPNNPSRGIVLTYKNGDWCNFAGTVSRSLSLSIMCADDTDGYPDTSETVTESTTCQYDLFFRSVYGCPTQCKSVDSGNGLQLCAGNGVCDFDTGLGAPRCFCNPGFVGSACDQVPAPSSPASKGVSAVGIVLIFVSIFLLAALALMWVLWKKVRTLRLDLNAYRSLAGADDPAGAAGGGGGGGVLSGGGAAPDTATMLKD
jgi:hypothetical protein